MFLKVCFWFYDMVLNCHRNNYGKNQRWSKGCKKYA